MSDSNYYSKGTSVYVGGLSDAIKKEDLETEFEKYGKLNHVWVAFNPPGFAFVEFMNKDEAESACDGMNGAELLGSTLRVEISRNRGRGRRGGGGGGGGGGFGGGRGGRSFTPRGGGGGYRGNRDRGSYGSDYGSRSYDRFGGGRDSYGGGGGGGGSSYDGGFRSRSPVSRGGKY